MRRMRVLRPIHPACAYRGIAHGIREAVARREWAASAADLRQAAVGVPVCECGGASNCRASQTGAGAEPEEACPVGGRDTPFFVSIFLPRCAAARPNRPRLSPAHVCISADVIGMVYSDGLVAAGIILAHMMADVLYFEKTRVFRVILRRVPYAYCECASLRHLRRMMHMWRRYGFTMVELLVIVAIISVLAALLLPALESSLSLTRQAACANTVRQLYLGMTQYAASWHDAIAKQDYGRGAGWTRYPHNIMNDTAIGSYRKVFNHGVWMTDGNCSPELYFDPGHSFEDRNGSLWYGREILRVQFNGPWRQILESGGMSGSYGARSTQVVNPAEYSLNICVTTGWTWTNGTSDMDGKGRGWRLSQMTSSFPLICDSRMPVGWDSIGSSSHDGRGFNVAYGDGSLQFWTTPALIQGGISGGINANYAGVWARHATMPLDPRQDPDMPYQGGNGTLVMSTVMGSTESYGCIWKTFRYLRKR